MGLDQAQHLSAEVFAAIRPAQPAAGDRSEAQMNPLDLRGIDEDLAIGLGLRQLVDGSAVELESDIGLGPALRVGLVVVRSQRCLQGVEKTPQDAVFIQVRDGLQRRFDLTRQCLFRLSRIRCAGPLSPSRTSSGRIEAGLEQLRQLPRDPRVPGQSLLHVGLAEGNAGLAQVLRVGAQDPDLPRRQTRRQNQTVEAIPLHLVGPGQRENLVKGLADPIQIDALSRLQPQGKVVDPDRRLGTAFQAADACRLDPDLVGHFGDYAQAHLLEHR